jgi:aspartyl-tRNA(Asn)/glutamyl-tRNA(Gln) amidotransferase subunit A
VSDLSRRYLELRIRKVRAHGLPHCLFRCFPSRLRRGRCESTRRRHLGPLDGTIINIKDLFDVAGEPTRAGSKLLAEEALPATVDAAVVRRLRAAGAVIAAKNNMSEFAATIIGANPTMELRAIQPIERGYPAAHHLAER